MHCPHDLQAIHDANEAMWLPVCAVKSVNKFCELVCEYV